MFVDVVVFAVLLVLSVSDLGSFSLALLSLARLGNLSNSCSSCSNIFFASSLLNSSSIGFRVDFFGVVFLLSIGFLFLLT